MTQEEQFFEQLLADTKQIFLESPVFAKQQQLRNQWNYSVCGTPIQKNKGILLGINWGADKDGNEPQSEIPDGKDIPTYKFIRQSRAFLKKYLLLDLQDINFNYTNLCFFRTPSESLLIFKDYENSLPLFKQFVEFIKPPWVFSLGNSNYKILLQLGQLSDIKEYFDSERKHKGTKAKLWGFNFYSVPHPNARVMTKSRNEIWELVGRQV